VILRDSATVPPEKLVAVLMTEEYGVIWTVKHG
jgi:hypothetical protein